MSRQSKVIDNVKVLVDKFGSRVNTDKKLLLAYWKVFDKVNMDNGIVVDDFLSKATNPMHIIQAREMLNAYEQSNYENEGW